MLSLCLSQFCSAQKKNNNCYQWEEEVMRFGGMFVRFYVTANLFHNQKDRVAIWGESGDTYWLGFKSSLFQGRNMGNCRSRVANRLLRLHQWSRIIFSNWFCSGTALFIKVESMFLLSEGKMSATRNRTNSYYSSYNSQRSC